MSEFEMAERTTILRCSAGSVVYGLNLPDNVADRDELGICVEDLSYAMAFMPFEQVVYRDAAIREHNANAKSQGGDLDLTIYSLRKYVRLALGGNPTIMALLYAPPEACIKQTAIGLELQALRYDILSKKAGRAFLGYMEAQRQRLVGERGQKDVNRPELVAKYGFDTKYAMHMLRLGFQGVELMRSSHMHFPMKTSERFFLLDVRIGKHPLQECLTMAGELERELKDLLDTTNVPDTPNTALVEQWMVKTYFDQWKQRDGA